MTIPVSQIVQVNPGVLAAAGDAVDLNGLILTRSGYPPIGAVPGFATADDVGAYFGSASVEKALADVYFGGYTNSTKKPGMLYFAQYPSANVAAYLRSASLAAMTLTQLKALSGTVIVTADGTQKTSTNIDLSTATSFSAAAATIATALGLAVTYDATKAAFVISSATTGAASTMTYATGTLAEKLLLTQATGAALSQGAVAGVPATTMDAITKVTQNWAAFTTTWEPSLADKVLFSTWTNAQNDRFAYAGWDSDVNATQASNTACWGYLVKDFDGSIPTFGTASHAAFELGYLASLDFDRLNGRATAAFRYQSGLAASVTDASVAKNLEANGYNFYGSYATAKESFDFFYPGQLTGDWKWIDTYANQIWLNANLQNAMIVLLRSVGSIPYNAAGYALVESACLDPIDAAINFGAIRTGVNLSTSQIAQIRNAVGSDVSAAILAKGYYLQIADASASTRVARSSPPITLYYADGGSIQKLTLASIEIQ